MKKTIAVLGAAAAAALTGCTVQTADPQSAEGIDDRTWSHKLNRPTKWSVCARN